MDKHLIPAEYGMILSAFAHSPTLRGAALLLNVDPSGLVRKVQKMADEYGLLQKAGNKWIMTQKGIKLNSWYDESVSRQKFLLNEKPLIRIASFAWLSEQSLIPNLHKLKNHFPNQYTWSFKTISSNLEQELINNRSDFVITGHAPNDPQVAYKRIFTKNWAVIAPYSWQKQIKGLKDGDLKRFLNTKPFVRFTAMNPAEILQFTPETLADVTVDGVIGIRTTVAHGLGWSCVPAMSSVNLEKEKQVLKLNYPTFLKDDVSIWWLRSRKDLSPVLKQIPNWLSELS